MISPLAWFKLRHVERRIAKAAIYFIHAWIKGSRADQHRTTVQLFQEVRVHPEWAFSDGDKTIELPKGKK